MLHACWQRIFGRLRHYIYWVEGGGGFPNKVKERSGGTLEVRQVHKACYIAFGQSHFLSQMLSSACGEIGIPATLLSDRAKGNRAFG